MLYLLPNRAFCPNPYWAKVVTYLRLWRLGCPVLNSAILTEKQDLEYLGEVVSHLGDSVCTLRFQYTRACRSPIRGGNAVAITKTDLERFWSDDRVLWPMEPTNRLSNRYGINIAYISHEKRIVFEIVGRGFDVADINRGYITPHQIIKVNTPEDRGFYGEIWKRASVSIVSEDEYHNSASIRRANLEKMGLDVSKLQFDQSFSPITLSMLERLDRFAQPVFESYAYAYDIVMSCSILEDGRTVFWDIQTGENKYAALYEGKDP